MSTKLALKTTEPSQEKHDLLAFFLFEKEKPSERAGLDELTGGSATLLEKLGDWKGKPKEQALLYSSSNARAPRVLLVGLGKREKASLEGMRRSAGVAVAKALALKAKSLGLVLAGGQVESALGGAEAASAAAEAAVLGAYKFEVHKTQGQDGAEDREDGSPRVPKKEAPPLSVTIYSSKSVKGAKEAVDLATLVAESSNLARDIANEPANFGTPTRLAEAARDAGKSAGFKVSVLDKAEMKRLGMGALLAVAQGSAEPPKFIVMDYEPKSASKSLGNYVIVGKGITFDSGGISIKPADKMWEMKYDKCGGCATIGVLHAVAQAKLPLRVIGLVPATENLPSGTAVKPGDVARAMSGKTIEIQNTDAEGRLILADALCYAARYEPSVVVDMATLTGACVVALGEVRAGLMGTDEGLIQDLKAAGDHTGEKVWPLPLDEEYGEHVKSDAADLKNLGRAGHAGAISAGYFLKHFAPPKARWAHIDMAGTAWGSDSGKNYVSKGATGFGVRLVFEYLKRQAGTAPKSRKRAAKAR
jgi:leucyl aminopeptidase